MVPEESMESVQLVQLVRLVYYMTLLKRTPTQMITTGHIWVFPKIVVPPNHPF